MRLGIGFRLEASGHKEVGFRGEVGDSELGCSGLGWGQVLGQMVQPYTLHPKP